MPVVTHITETAQETLKLGSSFAKALIPGDIVFLEGNLGAGKTMFTKGIARELGVKPASVVSPTFVLMNAYLGKAPLYHFDLYRIENANELRSLSLDEYFYGDGISVIEWPGRLGNLAPKHFWLVQLDHQGGDKRKVCISYPSNPHRSFSL